MPAKALAYAMGADYLEQDVVATRDDELVVLHDIHLDRVTDVAELYPDAARADGRFYVRDFKLEELRQLKVHERRNADGTLVYPGRYQSDGEIFRIHTFAEELAFIATLQRGAGRPVGIYPEIKRPAWHREQGVDITLLFLRTLRDAGYTNHDDSVYVQCFDLEENIRIRTKIGCALKLIQLIGDNSWQESATDYDLLKTRTGLAQLPEWVDGIGPWINDLYRVGKDGVVKSSGLVENAHDAGLAVHPFTLRKDDLAPGFSSVQELIEFLKDELCVDGVFTDFPDILAVH